MVCIRHPRRRKLKCQKSVSFSATLKNRQLTVCDLRGGIDEAGGQHTVAGRRVCVAVDTQVDRSALHGRPAGQRHGVGGHSNARGRHDLLLRSRDGQSVEIFFVASRVFVAFIGVIFCSLDLLDHATDTTQEQTPLLSLRFGRCVACVSCVRMLRL